jgi:hypothetical protein
MFSPRRDLQSLIASAIETAYRIARIGSSLFDMVGNRGRVGRLNHDGSAGDRHARIAMPINLDRDRRLLHTGHIWRSRRRVNCSGAVLAAHHRSSAHAVHGGCIGLRYDAAAHEESFAVLEAAVLNDGKAGRACSSEYVRPSVHIRQAFAPFGPNDLVADACSEALADRS